MLTRLPRRRIPGRKSAPATRSRHRGVRGCVAAEAAVLDRRRREVGRAGDVDVGDLDDLDRLPAAPSPPCSRGGAASGCSSGCVGIRRSSSSTSWMISVVRFARRRSFSVRLLNASVIIRRDHLGHVPRDGRGRREQVHHVHGHVRVAGILQRADHLGERRVVEQPAVPVRHRLPPGPAPSRWSSGSGRQAAAGGDVLGRQLHLLAVEAIQLPGDEVRGGQDQPRGLVRGRPVEVFRTQLLEVHVLLASVPRSGLVS